MSFPDPAPNFDWIAQNGLWVALIFLAVMALVAVIVVRWDRRERAKARAKWEQENPGKSWDSLNDRSSS